MIKAIFIDIDGTLRDSNRNLSTKTIETIKKVSEKGILVILCSGRPRKYTEEISRECFASKYIITSSGGNIYDYEQNKILYVNKMDKEALIKLYEIANPEDVRFIMNVGEGRVVNKVKHADQEKKLEENIKDFVDKNDVVQCTIADSNFDKIKNLIPKIEKVENVEIKNRHKSLLDIKFKDDKTVFCDIANIDSNKGIAVKKMLEILDIKKEESIAIGDDNNDLSMFEQVGYKVAMGNAIDIVKEKADEITLSNDEDGVAVFLERLLKEMEEKMKNKKGLILIYPGFQNEAKQYQYNRIIEEFNKKGISIDKLKVDEQYTSVINGKVNMDVKQYDFCIQLVKDKYINEQLCKNGIRSFNSYNAIENCDDKMMTYVILSNKNINLPHTILGSINFGVENIKEDNKSEEFKKYVETTLKYPFITKKCNSKGGRDIYKINNRKEFDDICNKLSGSQYLFQQFIPENIGKDIRVVVVGKKVVGSFMRINENDYRSNISLGGKALPYEVSNEYKEIAEKIANELELDYCSVDFFMSNENKPIVCEVNADPAICDIEELSGKNVAEIFVNYIINEIY